MFSPRNCQFDAFNPTTTNKKKNGRATQGKLSWLECDVEFRQILPTLHWSLLTEPQSSKAFHKPLNRINTAFIYSHNMTCSFLALDEQEAREMAQY